MSVPHEPTGKPISAERFRAGAELLARFLGFLDCRGRTSVVCRRDGSFVLKARALVAGGDANVATIYFRANAIDIGIFRDGEPNPTRCRSEDDLAAVAKEVDAFFNAKVGSAR